METITSADDTQHDRIRGLQGFHEVIRLFDRHRCGLVLADQLHRPLNCSRNGGRHVGGVSSLVPGVHNRAEGGVPRIERRAIASARGLKKLTDASAAIPCAELESSTQP